MPSAPKESALLSPMRGSKTAASGWNPICADVPKAAAPSGDETKIQPISTTRMPGGGQTVTKPVQMHASATPTLRFFRAGIAPRLG